MKRLTAFLKAETVLVIAACLALCSCFIVPPSAAYLSYIDFSTLALLFCLMAVVSGLQRLTVFDRIGRRLLGLVRTTRGLTLIASLLCFFAAMLVTNDVALITFVPLAILLCRNAGAHDRIIFTVVMQTISANLGSMLTPIGNPQNLYLYASSGASLGAFFRVTLAPTLVSLLLVTAACLLMPSRPLDTQLQTEKTFPLPRGKLLLYAALFGICLGTVLGLLHWIVPLAAVLVCLLLWDRPVLRQVDYALLATFVCFFVFVGNLGAWPAVSAFIGRLVQGNELASGVLASQVISNVPAALLLSGFTDHWQELLLGVNLGGLGTLIASLASLISYKLYARSENARTGRYMGVFTLWNVAFLAVLYGIFGIVF